MEGGFNNVLCQKVLDMVTESCKQGWYRWVKQFFRLRQFDVEWDVKVRRHGSANVCNGREGLAGNEGGPGKWVYDR